MTLLLPVFLSRDPNSPCNSRWQWAVRGWRTRQRFPSWDKVPKLVLVFYSWCLQKKTTVIITYDSVSRYHLSCRSTWASPVMGYRSAPPFLNLVFIYVHVCVPSEAREGTRSPGAGMREGHELTGCWDLNSGPLQDQQALLTTEHHFSPQAGAF